MVVVTCCELCHFESQTTFSSPNSSEKIDLLEFFPLSVFSLSDCSMTGLLTLLHCLHRQPCATFTWRRWLQNTCTEKVRFYNLSMYSSLSHNRTIQSINFIYKAGVNLDLKMLNYDQSNILTKSLSLDCSENYGVTYLQMLL